MKPAHLLRTVATGMITSALLAGLVLLQNDGASLRANDEAGPGNVPGFALGLVGLLSVISIAVSFGRGSAMHERQKRDRLGPTSAIVLAEYSRADLLAIGVIQGACLSLATLLCRVLAVDTGTPGTLWSSLTSDPLALLAVFGAAWASANIGVIFAALATAMRRNTLLSILSLAVFISLGVGMVFVFSRLQSTAPITCFVIAVIAVAVTVPLLIRSQKLASSCAEIATHDPRS